MSRASTSVRHTLRTTHTTDTVKPMTMFNCALPCHLLSCTKCVITHTRGTSAGETVSQVQKQVNTVLAYLCQLY